MSNFEPVQLRFPDPSEMERIGGPSIYEHGELGIACILSSEPPPLWCATFSRAYAFAFGNAAQPQIDRDRMIFQVPIAAFPGFYEAAKIAVDMTNDFVGPLIDAQIARATSEAERQKVLSIHKARIQSAHDDFDKAKTNTDRNEASDRIRQLVLAERETKKALSQNEFNAAIKKAIEIDLADGTLESLSHLSDKCVAHSAKREKKLKLVEPKGMR